jgi:hypothetical protein
MPENSIIEKVNSHSLLTDQSDSEVNGEHIRAHRFESHVTGPSLENSIFIGYQLTNQVSHETEVRFGFSMLDYLLSVGQAAKTCHSGTIQNSNG